MAGLVYGTNTPASSFQDHTNASDAGALESGAGFVDAELEVTAFFNTSAYRLACCLLSSFQDHTNPSDGEALESGAGFMDAELEVTVFFNTSA